MPRGPAAPMSAAVSIHCCERTARRVERERQARIAPRRAHQRAHRLLVRRQRLEPAHQHVEQPLARRLLGHVGVAAGEHRAVDVLHVRGEDRERRAELAAQFATASRRRGRRSRRGRSRSNGLLGEQRHERVDRLVAVGAARGGGRGGRALAGGARRVAVCGPWRPPDGLFELPLNLGAANGAAFQGGAA